MLDRSKLVSDLVLGLPRITHDVQGITKRIGWMKFEGSVFNCLNETIPISISVVNRSRSDERSVCPCNPNSEIPSVSWYISPYYYDSRSELDNDADRSKFARPAKKDDHSASQ